MKIGKFENVESLNIIKYCSWGARKRETMIIWKKLKITVEQKSFLRDWLKKDSRKAIFHEKWTTILQESRLVIADKVYHFDNIHDIQERSIATSHSKALPPHLRRTPTYQKIVARFFRYGIYKTMLRTA